MIPTSVALDAAQKRTTPAALPYAQVWSATIPSELSGPVRIAAGRTHLIVAGGNSSLSAIDVSDGHELWSLELHGIEVDPVTGGGLVYVIALGSLRVYDEATGRLRWQDTLDTTRLYAIWGRWIVTTAQIQPVWRGGWLVAASGTAVRGYRAEDGTKLWEQDLRSPVIGTIAIDGDEVFLATADRRLVTLNIQNGAIRWQQTLEWTPRAVYAANGRIYFGASDERFHCFRQTGGREIWAQALRVDTIGQPVVDEHSVYITTFDNSVLALNRDSGARNWRAPLKLRPAGPVFLDGGQAIVPLVSGEIQLLLAASGKEAGLLSPPAATDPTPGAIRFERMEISTTGQIFRLTSLTAAPLTLSSYARRTIGVSGMTAPPGRGLPPPGGRGGHP